MKIPKNCKCYSYMDKKNVLHLIQCDRCGGRSKPSQEPKSCSQECKDLNCRGTKNYPQSGSWACKCNCHYSKSQEPNFKKIIKVEKAYLDKITGENPYSKGSSQEPTCKCKYCWHGNGTRCVSQPSEWEERFDYNFTQAGSSAIMSSVSSAEVKQFIKELLVTQRQQIQEEIEKCFDDYRSSNVKDEKGRRIFGVPDFNVGLRKLHSDILKLLS